MSGIVKPCPVCMVDAIRVTPAFTEPPDFNRLASVQLHHNAWVCEDCHMLWQPAAIRTLMTVLVPLFYSGTTRSQLAALLEAYRIER